MFTNRICTFDGLESVCRVDNSTTYMLMTAIKNVRRSILKFDVVGC